MDEEMIQYTVDPASVRADKIVELLHIRRLPEYADEYSQAVLTTMITGMMKPFLPELQPVSREGNVIHMEKQ